MVKVSAHASGGGNSMGTGEEVKIERKLNKRSRKKRCQPER